MKKKLLVIFFLLCIILAFIYNKYKYDKINVLLLGDSQIINSKHNYLEYFDDKYKINTFLFDNITYNELYKSIKNNNKKVIKNKDVYLNQLISKSNMIIINANNNEYFNKCKKSNNIINNYNEILSESINQLVNLIKKISKSKVIVIGNYCKNKYIKQDLKITNYINYYEVDNSKDLFSKIIEEYN